MIFAHRRPRKLVGIGVAVLGCMLISVAAYTALASIDPSVVVIELVGTSPESWEKAAAAAVERAGKSLKDLRIAEVEKLDLQIENGKVAGYRAKVKVSFKFSDRD